MIAPADDDRDGSGQAHADFPVADPSAAAFVEPGDLVVLAVRFRRRLGIVESRISGHSMHTTLPAGSRIRIQCGDLQGVGPGMVVAFVASSSLMAHRVVGRGRGARARGFLLTRGDATIICDAPIHTENVLGVVTHVAIGDLWRPLPRVHRGLVARVAGGAIWGAMVLAMELDTRAARAVAFMCFRLRSLAQRVTHRIRRMLDAP